MSRWRAALIGLALIALVAGCSRLDAASAFPAGRTSAPSHAVPSTSGSAPTVPSTSPGATTPAPVPPAPAPPPIAPPTTYHGSDSTTLTIAKPAGAGAVIATISGNAARRNFNIRALDGAHDHLVTTTSPYTGSTLLDVTGTTTRQLRVHGVGPWSITLTDVRSAPVFSLVYHGTGDGVFLSGAGGSVLLRAEGAGTPFSMRTYGARGTNDAVTETGPWGGQIDLPPGNAIVAVRAAGAWSVTLTHR